MPQLSTEDRRQTIDRDTFCENGHLVVHRSLDKKLPPTESEDSIWHGVGPLSSIPSGVLESIGLKNRGIWIDIAIPDVRKANIIKDVTYGSWRMAHTFGMTVVP
jgi:hypothetical protein